MTGMKYDLVVVGGGPGGLMAAKTAAEDGLKVIMIERKRNITEINRTCNQEFYIRKLSPSKAGYHGDGYIEPVSLEVDDKYYRLHFPGPGFSLDYTGPLKPYFNAIHLSPSGYRIYDAKDDIRSFFYQKEAFLTGLLTSAQRAGAEILPETIGLGAENGPDGVKVIVRGKVGLQTIEARAAIAADGINSNIVESLGMNKKRRVLGPLMKFVGYDLEGVETDLPPCSVVCMYVPSINYGRFCIIVMGQMAGDRTALVSGTEEELQKLMRHPTFSPWFHHAQVVNKNAVAVGTKHGILTPIEEPVEGNVLVVGDAGAVAETWIQGAVASAYMAVKGIEKELNGQRGYAEYISWWQKAFYFHNPEYFRMLFQLFGLASALSFDEDVDYLFNLFQDRKGYPQTLIFQNLEMIKVEKPELYDRLRRGYEEAEKMLPLST
jgi:flavin-dependent dehydrogenase